MNLGEIRDAVRRLTQEFELTTAQMNSKINDVYKLAAIRSQIPELKGIGTVTTVASQAYTSLSSLTGGFSGVLTRIREPGQTGNITIYPTLELLVDQYEDLDTAGDVEAVAVEGTMLWYQYIPADPVTLSVIYFKNPTELSSDSDIPSLIPAAFHRKVFVSGTAMLVWEDIEDGMEERPNTLFHRGVFDLGVTDFISWLAVRKKHYISSSWRI